LGGGHKIGHVWLTVASKVWFFTALIFTKRIMAERQTSCTKFQPNRSRNMDRTSCHWADSDRQTSRQQNPCVEFDDNPAGGWADDIRWQTDWRIGLHIRRSVLFRNGRLTPSTAETRDWEDK
jgi:hypothetical protein